MSGEPDLKKAAAEVICDEVEALLDFMLLTGKIPQDRLEGLKTRIALLREIL